MSLSFTIAAGHRQRIHSQVREKNLVVSLIALGAKKN
jgi:hypothetical protein